MAALMLAAPALADVFTVVPAAANYTLVYTLAIPASDPNFSAGIPYSVDNSASVTKGSFDRIAYYLELQTGAGPLQWIWVSMDAFTTQASKIGVPTVPTGEFYYQDVIGLEVASNVGGILTGSGINTGRLEFWPSNYAQPNTAAVPNASGSTYDWGDSGATGTQGYGSMQIANYGASQMLISYNRWNGSGASDLGIGNQSTGNPDWTFASNSGGYTVRNLQILVSTPVPEPSPALLLASGLLLAGAARRARSRRRRAQQPLTSSARNSTHFPDNR